MSYFLWFCRGILTLITLRSSMLVAMSSPDSCAAFFLQRGFSILNHFRDARGEVISDWRFRITPWFVSPDVTRGRHSALPLHETGVRALPVTWHRYLPGPVLRARVRPLVLGRVSRPCSQPHPLPYGLFNPFTPKSDQFQIPLQPHQKYYITQYGEFDFP